jgi:hypothetical protein
MRSVVVIGVVLALAGCSGAGAEAERRYEIVDKSGSPEQRCTEAQKVADAYLSDHKDAEFEKWSGKARTECALSRVLGEEKLNAEADKLEEMVRSTDP